MQQWQRYLACARKRATLRKDAQDFAAAAEGGVSLSKCLGAIDLLLLGIGSAVGAGIFVVTGVAAQSFAGCAASRRVRCSLTYFLSALVNAAFKSSPGI